MPDFIEGAKKGGILGAIAGVAIYGLAGLIVGGPVGMLGFAISGAINWGIGGAIVGGITKAITGSPSPEQDITPNAASSGSRLPPTHSSQAVAHQAPLQPQSGLIEPVTEPSSGFVARENARREKTAAMQHLP